MVSTSDVVDHTTDPDPSTGLRAVAALRRLVEQLEDLQVEHARALGWSWADIATALGVSRQAVHKKHSGHTSLSEKR
jgi:DNA-directed RNA polymerase specialized sigma24 family protein